MQPNAKGHVRELQEVCRELQTGQNTNTTGDDRQLFTKLGELARYLDETMRKLCEVERPLVSSADQLPHATDALTGLTRMTEEGTHKVIELTEELLKSHRQFRAGLETIQIGLSEEGADKIGILAQVAGLADLAVLNQKALMDIMTALSFQDLAGQRIKKVVGILDEVQSRLLELVVVFGLKVTRQEADGGRAVGLLKELEQTKTTAIKQDVVDDLLREFGF